MTMVELAGHLSRQPDHPGGAEALWRQFFPDEELPPRSRAMLEDLFDSP